MQIEIHKRIVISLNKVINYLWREEYDHWEEEGTPDNHIFHSINDVKNWLEFHTKQGEK